MIEQVKYLTYKVNQISSLEQEVNNLITQGWQPIGELKILKLDGTEVVMQQMVFNSP